MIKLHQAGTTEHYYKGSGTWKTEIIRTKSKTYLNVVEDVVEDGLLSDTEMWVWVIWMWAWMDNTIHVQI